MKESQSKIRAIAAQIEAAQTNFPAQSSQPLSTLDPGLQLLWQRLEDQMQYVNQLAVEQEAAISRLEAIVQQVKRDRNRTPDFVEADDISNFFAFSSLESHLEQTQKTIAIPYIEKTEAGELRVFMRSIDLSWLDREAALPPVFRDQVEAKGEAKGEANTNRSAQSCLLALRQGATWAAANLFLVVQLLIQFTVQGIAQVSYFLFQLAIETGCDIKRRTSQSAQAARRSKQSRNQSFNRCGSTQQSIELGEIFPSLQQAFILILGAALLRALLDRLSQLYPVFSLVSVMLMVVPAAVAMYRATVAPQSGFLWGSRLTLIMIGLLLGGRL
jgi:hypothetical protein